MTDMKQTLQGSLGESGNGSLGESQLQEVAVGRAVDLFTLNGYAQLRYELENMFHIEGELGTGSKWANVYTDNEGDQYTVNWDLFH
ncbi:hypothetical protein QQ045_004634 [Rhodiola kirilowii]